MEEEIGRVTHFFSKISVAVVAITTGSLKVGEVIRIKGHTSDLAQPVDSLQKEHQSITEVKAGDSAALKVKAPVREGDLVFKVKEEA
jgi:translation elongation factor EF-1alpha